MRINIPAHYLALLLIFVSAFAWIAEIFWLDNVLVIDYNHQSLINKIIVYGDQGNEGASNVEFIATDTSWVMNYELIDQAPYPYTTLQIDLTQKNGTGIDLSNFEKVIIYAQSSGQNSDRMRMHLRNEHPSYSVVGDNVSLKYNEVHFPPLGLQTPLVLKWDKFQIPGWWLTAKKIPYEQANVDVSNVRFIEFVTPENERKGSGHFELRRIEFHGKIIATDTFFKGIVVFWMFIAMGFSIVRFRELRCLLLVREKNEQELQELNRVLAIQSQEMEKKATYDELTGLLNRFGLRGRIVNDLKENNFALILVDIDHFKKINDTYGHNKGDQILYDVAQTLKNNTSHTDVVARWGGEEFLIICPQTTRLKASLIAERLRNKVMSLPDQVTCSFGVSAIKNQRLQAAISQADEALYKAKNSGRNRVEVFSKTKDKI